MTLDELRKEYREKMLEYRDEQLVFLLVYHKENRRDDWYRLVEAGYTQYVAPKTLKKRKRKVEIKHGDSDTAASESGKTLHLPIETSV